jgi:Cu+-exporting ATPase
VSGVADGHAVVAGRPDWIKTEWAQPIPAALADRAGEAEAAGQTAVFAGWDGRVRGVLADTIKPTSAEAVARLHRKGLEPVLLIGDNHRAAREVGRPGGNR